jgi:hypothetical protein
MMTQRPHFRQKERFQQPVSAPPPTALSAVFRRLSTEISAQTIAPEAPLFDENEPELFGFEEPVLHIPEPPPEPAVEDILALLAEQPEVAPFVDVHMASLHEVVAVAPPVHELEPSLEPAPEPAAESRSELEPDSESDLDLKSEFQIELDAEPEPVPELPPEPEPDVEPPFDPLPPEPLAGPRQAPIARFTSRLAPRPVVPAVSRKISEPEPPEAAEPEPLPPIPPMPLPRRPVEPPPPPAASALSAAAPDRNGRQSLSRNRRLYRRVQLGAEIEIDGTPSTLIDVSVGGFAATGMANIIANTIVPVALRLTIDGIEVGTQVHARVVYANRERVSGRFIELTASQTAFLRYIVTWRGESVGTVGTTTLLDTITGGPLHGFAPKTAQESRERWWHGMIGRKIQPPR